MPEIGIDVGQIISSGINQVGNLTTTLANNALSQMYFERNQASNYAYNEMAADNADDRQRAQWKDFYSPQAQIKNMREAGLSPSLIGGAPQPGGHATGAMGNGANGPQQQVFPFSAIDFATIGNILADTQLKKAEAKNMESTSELTVAQIAKTYQETDNMKMYYNIMSVDHGLKEIQLRISKAGETHEIDRIISQANIDFYTSVKVQYEAESAQWKAKYDAATFETNVKQATAEYENIIADTASKWAGIELTNAQIESLAAHIAIDQYNAETNRMNAETQLDHLNAQIAQWAEQNGIAKDTLKHEKTKKWLEFSASIFGSICNVAKAFVKPRF